MLSWFLVLKIFVSKIVKERCESERTRCTCHFYPLKIRISQGHTIREIMFWKMHDAPSELEWYRWKLLMFKRVC